MLDFEDASGWSLSSGGPSMGKSLSRNNTYDYDVIFDANSGPSRTITGRLQVTSIDMSGSKPMVFEGMPSAFVADCLAVSESSTINGTVQAVRVIRGTSAQTLKTLKLVAGTVLDRLSVAGIWQLASPLVVTTELTIQNAQLTDTTFYARGFPVSCGSFHFASNHESYLCRVYLEGANLEVLKSVGVTAPAVLHMNTNVSGGNGAGMVFDHGGGSIFVRDKTAAIKVINARGFNFGNFVNDTEGGLEWASIGSGVTFSFVSYDAGKNTVNRFPQAHYFTAATWIMDGAGQYTTIQMTTTTGTRPIITKSGGGQITANYCKFQNISVQTGTNIKALNSVDLGGNTGTAIAYSFVNSRFLSHYHC